MDKRWIMILLLVALAAAAGCTREVAATSGHQRYGVGTGVSF